MLTDDDIQKLITVVATKEDLTQLKESLRQDFSDLQTSIDAYAKKANDYFQEMVMFSRKLERHEKWLQQLAQKLEVKLEY